MQHWTKIPGLSQEDMETFFKMPCCPVLNSSTMG